ncbi:MAG: CGNR zinc finger domain-containing protein [Chloroflexota bacterium]
METQEEFRGHRIVGGSLALDLLNTQNGPAGGQPEDDALSDYPDVVAWARSVGMLDDREADRLVRRSRSDPQHAQSVFERTVETRAYLYSLFSAIARGAQPSPHDVDRLQRDEAEALAHASLVDGDGGYHWSWTADPANVDLAGPLWQVIHAALTLLTEGKLDRVKGCAACRFHFLDESKNRSRRWCSMDDCGAADKMRKYVARRASARSARRNAAG